MRVRVRVNGSLASVRSVSSVVIDRFTSRAEFVKQNEENHGLHGYHGWFIRRVPANHAN